MEATLSKICSKCKAEKELTEFCKDSRSKDGYVTSCKICRSKYHRDYHYKNKERTNAKRREFVAKNREYVNARKTASYYRCKYGLTMNEVTVLRSAGCSVCGSTDRVVIDHCHITEKVRGALCNNCNVALGHAKESPERLRQLASYLEEVGE